MVTSGWHVCGSTCGAIQTSIGFQIIRSFEHLRSSETAQHIKLTQVGRAAVFPREYSAFRVERAV